MHPSDQSRVAVILVRARNPQNIGAVARAMHDLGFSDLRIVNPFPVPFQAAKSAVDASEVLASAQEFTTLAEALHDRTSILGTTAVGERVLHHPILPLNQAATRIRADLATPDTHVALLFGSEKTGLTNDELSHCTSLLTIPMSTHGLSMNLGQAAAVCLYQLAQGDAASTPPIAQEPLAKADDQERLTQLLTEVMQSSGYTRRHPANAREMVVRRLIRRLALTPEDTAVWTGLLKQILRTQVSTASWKEVDPAT